METKTINPKDLIIKDIPELSTRTKNALTRGLYTATIADLLELDYEQIRRARRLGAQGLEEIKDYLHSIGYSIKGEEETIEEIIKIKKAEGLILLEETISDPKLYLPLYRAEIYTLEDLQNRATEIPNINGYGPTKQQLLKEALAKIGISLILSENIGSYITPTPSISALIEEQKAENQSIKERLRQKRELIEEYKSLIAEKESLLAEEKELDTIIAEQRNNLGSEHHAKKLGIG